MSTADKLNKLLETKQAIKQAIIDKGIDVADDTVFADYPSKIASIEVGSGEGGGGGDPFYEELHNMKTNNGTSFNYLFYQCQSSTLDLSKLDTSNTTNMERMFDSCPYLNTLIGLDKWKTNNVIKMDGMFSSCGALTSLDLSSWDISNVTGMYGMFAYCGSLTSLNLSSWNTGNVIGMDSMFSGCNSLTLLDLSSFNTSKVVNMSYMFSYMQNSNLPKLDLSNFTTEKLEQAYGMFNWCNMLQELDIRNFELVHENGTEVTIGSMLEGCNELHTLRLDNCSNATISKIINESGMPQEQAYINGEYVTRKIYCKAKAAEGLSLPPGWGWEMV